MSCAVSTSGRGGSPDPALRDPVRWTVCPCPRAGQQVGVQLLDGQPLEVHHVGGARQATVAQHVGDVLGELGRRAQALADLRSARRSERGAVEQLAPHIPVGGWDGAVGEAARDERHLGAGAGKGAAQRVVVRRRIGRGIDDVDAHRKHNRRGCGDNVRMTSATTLSDPALMDGADEPEIELTYCVVNTSQRELLLRGLDAIARERAAVPFATEVLVLDNGSRDGSARAARAHPAVDEVIALGQRRGKALNDSALMTRARGSYALLLNEDSELLAGATLALWQALEEHPDAACAGAQLLRPDGEGTAEEEEEEGGPGMRVAVPDGRHGARRRRVPAPRVHRAEHRRAHARGGLVPVLGAARTPAGGGCRSGTWTRSSSSTPTRSTSPAGCATPAGAACTCRARARSTTSSCPRRGGERRIVELARNRDLYMRKHHSVAAARAVRWLTAWSYAWRALAALALPGHSPRRYWRHVTATLRPERGEGLREAAQDYNRTLTGL